MPKVRLTEIEMEIAALVGVKRRSESKSKGRVDNNRSTNDPWQADIEGAAAETAYAKFRNQFWTASVGSFKEADHGKSVQIRWTKYRDGSLIIREADSDDHFYVLVVGEAPNLDIVGWLRGCDGKNPDYVRDPGKLGKAYMVPQSRLKPFRERAAQDE